jgi:hypothetical protein
MMTAKFINSAGSNCQSVGSTGRVLIKASAQAGSTLQRKSATTAIKEMIVYRVLRFNDR